MIRKTILLVTGTVAGVVGVVGYNPPQLDSSIASSGVAPTTTSSAPTNTSTSSPAAVKSSTSPKPKAVKVESTPKPTQSTTSPAAESATPAKSSGVFQGDTSYTRWGPVQVEVTVTNGQITDISTLQYPSGDRKSLSISNRVIPWLQQETLNVQSASITGVSGATYTSTGFKASLASALQKAGL